MQNSDKSAPAFSNQGDAALAAAGQPSVGMAVATLMLGIASAVALLSQMLWLVPGIGLAFGLLALRSDATASSFWRGVTIVGLILSMIFLTWAPSAYLLRQWRLSQQSAAVGEQWLTLMLNNEPLKAFTVMQPPEERPLLDRNLESFYLSVEESRSNYENFVNRKLPRTLIALGPRAYVRFYDRVESFREDGNDQITNLYAVTYMDEGKNKTFFVRLVLERQDDVMKTAGLWRVLRYETGATPENLASKAKEPA